MTCKTNDRIRNIFLTTALTLALSACLGTTSKETASLNKPLKGQALTATLPPPEQGNRLRDPFVRLAVEQLQEGNYLTAQKAFNRALKYDPTNSSLHFLNGLTYHLRAEAGDSSQLDYARAGYQLALEHDAANYWAAYQLGTLNLDGQHYHQAQEAFSYALLYDPDNPLLLKALAVASYYAQDVAMAAAAVEKVKGGDNAFLRSSAMIMAAAGRFDRAKGYLARYAEVDGVRPSWVKRARRRIGDWRDVHARNDGFRLAQSTSDIFGEDDTSQGLKPDKESSKKKKRKGKKSHKPEPEKMTMVDVVIIRSEERHATDKGVNLLNGLTATLGGTTISLNDVQSSGSGANNRATTLTIAPSLSVAANYALNIFNDNNDHNEVLARPSLIALDGKKSDFFTGAVIHVQLNGAAGSQGAVAQVPIGIKLTVTPKFLKDGKVELEVQAARAFIENASNQVGFANTTQVTKTEITANVTMNFGDTLVIGGLSEKETESLHDGVPLIQDIPVIQYLFSHEDTLDFTKSVLILLTPKQPRYTYADGTAKVDPAKAAASRPAQPSLDKLKGRHDWFRPASNLDSVFHHLKSYKFFKDFRTGDVTLENWDNPVELGDRIKGAIDFLYY